MAHLQKAIPPARDRLQSRILVWIIAVPLSLFATAIVWSASGPSTEFSLMPRSSLLEPLAVSFVFALVAWRMRAATLPAAACGGLICLSVTLNTANPYDSTGTLLHSALLQLAALFVLTFAATRAGRTRKAQIGVAESRTGRSASQVIANLGVAAAIFIPLGTKLFAPLWSRPHSIGPFWATRVLVLAALAEATADTVSSEIGQAFGGTPFLLTTFCQVAPGTDGAISPRGTLYGILAAAIVAATGAWTMRIGVDLFLISFAAAIFGLFFDSLLGATVERKGLLGNDLVNFTSTAFAAATALLAIYIFPTAQPSVHINI